MAKLPKNIREEIIDLFIQGKTNEYILDKIIHRSSLPLNELSNCIRSLKGVATQKMNRISEKIHVKYSTVHKTMHMDKHKTEDLNNLTYIRKGTFDNARYSYLRKKIIEVGNKHAKAESYYKIIAKDILEEFEGFDSVIPAPNFQGRPFDLFALRKNTYSTIELKGSLKGSNMPSQTQLVRMEDLLGYLKNENITVNPYLLQITLDEGFYRLWMPKGVIGLFKDTDKTLGKYKPIAPIGDWIKQKVLFGIRQHEDTITFTQERETDDNMRQSRGNKSTCFFHETDTIIHPPKYLQRQIIPTMALNDLSAEIVWTYLIAHLYENQIEKLVELLCGRKEALPPEPKIWLEAYLHPTRIRREESRYWKVRADLALGHLKRVSDRKHQIHSNGSWICIAEAKWYDDIHENRLFTDISQLSQLIEHALFMPGVTGVLPERVYVTLITPRYFKNREGPFSFRQYHDKFWQYKNNKEQIIQELEKCALTFYENFDRVILLSRINNNLILNWVTFEDLLSIDGMVHHQVPGKYRTRVNTWEEVFNSMRSPITPIR